MDSYILEQYSHFVDFLGKVLSPDYEIVLQKIDLENKSIIAIANNNISGRSVGAPITDLALKVIKDRIYEKKDYILNYKGVSKSNKVLRSSTFFIKNEKNELIGLLCINFDNSRYKKLGEEVQNLCQPSLNNDPANLQNILPKKNAVCDDAAEERFSDSISDMVKNIIKDSLPSPNIPIDRLTQTEKLNIIKALNQKGIFLLKGAVSCVAKNLSCSEPTIYRYLSSISKD